MSEYVKKRLESYETPKRFTSVNESTGQLMKTKAGTKEEQSNYARGWDLVFNKQEKEAK